MRHSSSDGDDGLHESSHLVIDSRGDDDNDDDDDGLCDSPAPLRIDEGLGMGAGGGGEGDARSGVNGVAPVDPEWEDGDRDDIQILADQRLEELKRETHELQAKKIESKIASDYMVSCLSFLGLCGSFFFC